MAEEPDRFAHMPTAVMSDLLSEIRNQLVGHYSHLNDTAETGEARDLAWREMLALRDQDGQIGPGDRTAMIELITAWGARLRALRAED
jgi:hypothetical protein